jgi:parallel beta-helix repeat protein
MKKFLITVIISCLTTAVSEAATYYVAKTGSNSNTCTQAQSQSTPKLTVTSGASCLKAGDTLYIKAGIYSETGGSINLPAAASWAGATTVSVFGSDVVTFSNSGNPFRIFGYTLSYVIFNGFVFDGTGAGGGGTGIAIGQGVHHLRFTNYEVKNFHDQGHQIGASGNEFLNCSVHDNGTDVNLDHGFYISGADNLVDRCKVYSNKAFGVHLYNGANGGTNNNVVRNNTVYNNGLNSTQNTAGIILSTGSGNVAYNNIIYGNFGGIQVGTNSAAINNKVYNNTIYANRFWGIDLESGSSGAIIKNNIVYQNPSGAIVNSGTSTVTGNNLTTDPKFVNASIKDFHLQTGSAAIDAGTNLLSEGLTVDFAGDARPQGCCFDIGAYEYGSSSNLIAPTNLIAGP